MLRFRLTALAIALCATATTTAAQQRRVEYEISFPNAEQHEARVTATFRGVPAGRALQLRMSRSSPGRYALAAFAKNVYDVTATDGRGRRLAPTRPDPHGWDVAGHDGTVRVSYTVWGDRIDGTYLGVDRTHAHMNMPATFMWARGMEAAPIRLTIRPRDGWRVATQLVPTSDSTVFTAPNLQWFMDSPTEVGPIVMRSWQGTYGGRTATWRLAVHHPGDAAQVDSFAAMARAVVAEHIAVWGEPAPYDHGTYTFIADYLPWASGDGMEHRNSTIISGRGALVTRTDRINRLGTLSHEFFHSWNVERLRPRGLEPFDFERENMAGELWLAEGFTTYYGDLLIRRAGLVDDDAFAADMAGNVIGVVNAPGRTHFSLTEMSMLAPLHDGAVSLDPVNRQNTFVSYYPWGATVALALDLTLRERFDLTLDDYMRALWRGFGRFQTPALAPARPYTGRDARRTLGTLVRDTAFANDFFRRHVDGREVPDFGPLLAPAGFLFAADSAMRPWLGASLDDDTTAVFVNSTGETGSLFRAGIANGDRIHAVDGTAVTTVAALDAALAAHRVGDVVQLDVTQRGRRRTIPVTLVGRRALRLVTYEKAGLQVTDAMRDFRRRWLGSHAVEAGH